MFEFYIRFTCKSVSLLFIYLTFIQQVILQQSCKHNPSYKYRSASLHMNAIEALTSYNFLKRTMHIPKLYDHQQWVYIYHIKGSKPRQEFIVCTTPKAGSTRTNMVWKKIQNPNYKGKIGPELYDQAQYHPLEWANASHVEKLLSNSSIPRYIIVRNPYIRAVSMYQEKIKRVKNYLMYKASLGLENYGYQDITFDQFAQAVYERTFRHRLQQNTQLDRHFISQSSLCGLDLGMTYNYVLKQEEIQDWFDCYIDDINAREEVMHGWPGENDCYFSTQKNPCNGPYFRGGKLVNVDKKTRGHSTNGVDYLDLFYKNKTTLRLVTDLFKDDIINFDYGFMI